MDAPKVIPGHLAALALAIACALPRVAPADDPQEEALRAAGIKAAYIYKLANYHQTQLVLWPERAFDREDAPVRLGVVGDLGDDPLAAVLRRVLGGKRIGPRPLRIDFLGALPPADDTEAWAAATARMRRCHLLFIAAAETARLAEIRAALADAPTLTLSDAAGFARRGGMIEFVLVEGSIVFDINRWAASRAGLRLHGSLLTSAHRLLNAPPPEEQP